MAFEFPRSFLTFSELISHWGCSANDIRQAVVAGDLKPVIRTADELLMPDWDEDPVWGLEPSGHLTEHEGDQLRTSYRGWLHLQNPQVTAPCDCLFRLAATERNPDWPDKADEIRFGLWYWLPAPMHMKEVEERAVFLRQEILDFETSHSSPSATPALLEKPLDTKSRNTLLCIIAALCKEVGYDYKTHAKTAALIQSTAAHMGVSIGETTIEEYLKKIPNALAARMK